MEDKNKPEKQFKFGGVRVTIWKDVRKGSDGKSFETRSVTLDRAYKDASGEWKNSHSLRENDVPKAIAALQKAFIAITEREAQEMNGDSISVEEEFVGGRTTK